MIERRKNYHLGVPWIVMIASLVVTFQGCFLNSTFQTAEVMDPGRVRTGAAVSLGVGPRFESHTRVGIMEDFDIGLKYGIVDHVLVDGKYQLLHNPVDLSFSLGFSYNGVDVSSTDLPDRKPSFGFFPLILVGRKGEEAGWYAGLRGLYISRSGIESEFIRESTLFRTTGWIAQGLVIGGFLHGKGVRFMNELNLLYSTKHQYKIIFTIGFQFDVS
jgi:hypothetical protein